MKVVLLILALSFVTIVLSSRTPTLDGTWTESKYGGKLYICIDDNLQLWATYSQAGVLWGKVSADKTEAYGNWYEAGNGKCGNGTFKLFFNDAANTILNYTFTCGDDTKLYPTNYSRTEARLATFANDDECNVVTTPTDVTGSWANKQLKLNFLHICSYIVDGIGRASISMQYDLTDLFVDGYEYASRKIIRGHYYSRYDGVTEEGAYLFFALDREKAIQFFWQGSLIDPALIDEPLFHRVETPIAYKGSENPRCRQFVKLADQVIAGVSTLTASFFVFTLLFLLL